MQKTIMRAKSHEEIILDDTVITTILLDNGIRIFPYEDIHDFLGIDDDHPPGEDSMALAIRQMFYQTKFNDILAVKLKPINFRIIEYEIYDDIRRGYEVSAIETICNALLDIAVSEKRMTLSQQGIVSRIRGFCQRLILQGISSLPENETVTIILKNALDKYARDAWAKWSKTFPLEFYENLLKLKGISYQLLKSERKLRYIGFWLRDIIYSRLTVDVLNTLKEKSPKTSSSVQELEFNYYRLDNRGHRDLLLLMIGITFLMKGCTRWRDFKRRLDRAAPAKSAALLRPYGDDSGY